MKLFVLMVNTYQGGGGAGQAAELLAQKLRQRGDRVVAFARRRLEQQDCVHPAGHWRDRRLSAALAARGWTDLGQLSTLLWHCRPEYAAADVLHWHNLHGDYLSLAAAAWWGLEKPIVWTLQDLWPVSGNCAVPAGCRRWERACGHCPQLGTYPLGAVDHTWVYRRLKPRLLAAARPLLVSPSRWLAEQIRRLPQYRRLPLRIIPNPVATEVFHPVPQRAPLRRGFGLDPAGPTVVLAGRSWDDPLKGGRHAAQALRQAAAAVPGLQVVILGQGSARLLAETGRPGRAREFTRGREELARALACADLCLFPSLADNYPLTTLEAMACGTPVVAFAVGGIPEQVHHLRTGYLAPEGRTEALAAGIAHLLTQPRLARALGGAGRAFVLEHAQAERVAEHYRSAYAAAARAWRRRRSGRAAAYARGRLACWLARRLGWELTPPVRAQSAALLSNEAGMHADAAVGADPARPGPDLSFS